MCRYFTAWHSPTHGSRDSAVWQSTKSVAELEQRLDAFIGGFVSTLAALSDADFEEHVASLVLKKLEPDRSADKRCERLAHEIFAHNSPVLFDRPAREVAELRALVRTDLLDFYAEFVAPARARHFEPMRYDAHTAGRSIIVC